MHWCVNNKENVMNPKGKLFIALAVALFTLPTMVSAQQGSDQPGPDYGQQGPGPQQYGRDQSPGAGDQQMQDAPKHARHAQKSVYPQFRSIEKRIRHTVREARQGNTLGKRDAHKLMAQLKQIQTEEMSVYNAHGMNLPADAQARIQGELTQLAAQVGEQSRAQPGSGQPYQGQQ
jgi:uncharacterized membrane protein